MYDELIAELRQHHCDAKEDDTQEVCEECAYDVIIVDKSAPSGIASVCVCGLMNRAANAIEELIRKEKFHAFLWNTIQPNEMEQYVSMYNSGNIPQKPPKEET